MDPLIASVIITWLLMRAGRAVRNEWQHSRDTHGNDLARQHPDWSPHRVRRNARRRARGDWLTEIRDGFPSLKQSLAEDRLLARTVREERIAAGEDRMRGLRERLNAAVRKREAGRPKQDATDPGSGRHRRRVTPGPADAAIPAGPVTVWGPCPGDDTAPPLLADIGKPAPGPSAAIPPGACPWCHGSGDEPLSTDRCGWCKGSGKVPGPSGRPSVRSYPGRDDGCPGCGELPGQPCLSGCDCMACHLKAQMPDPRLNDTQRQRDADPRLRNACAACGNPGTAEDPLVVHPDGFRVHESHVTDPDSGLYVPPAGEDPPWLQEVGERYQATGEVPAGWTADGDPAYDDPFPEPDPDDWPTGIPHRRNGDAPSPATEGDDEMTTDMQIDTALENADTPHEAMQGAFRQIGARAAQFAQAASDELAAAAAVHGMDRDPQTMADIAALADHAQALQAQADAAATGLASRHADGAEYHGSGRDAHASAFRPS
jgi:hypothetical protein